jgi:hypothetical protein
LATFAVLVLGALGGNNVRAPRFDLHLSVDRHCDVREGNKSSTRHHGRKQSRPHCISFRAKILGVAAVGRGLR